MAPLCAGIEHEACAGSLEPASAQAESLGREFASTRLELEQVIRGMRNL